MSLTKTPRIAVLIPCRNEALTVAKVVASFRAALPDAALHVFDNNSTDATAQVALAAGAHVLPVVYPGKGNVVRRMFAEIEADVYVLVDGDDTYEAKAAPAMIERLLVEGLDMVVGTRETEQAEAYRAGHRFGNVVLTEFVARLFGRSFTDMLSGYRVFSRRYVKSFPAQSAGFEIETELTVHALEMRMPVAEVATRYGARPLGSHSKLNTYRDGFRILFTIAGLFKAERPLLFFSLGFLVCFVTSILLAVPIFQTYLRTGLVPRLPTAVACAALMLFGAILLTCGIVVDTVTLGRGEAKRLAYLAIPGPLSLRHDAR